MLDYVFTYVAPPQGNRRMTAVRFKDPCVKTEKQVRAGTLTWNVTFRASIRAIQQESK